MGGPKSIATKPITEKSLALITPVDNAMALGGVLMGNNTPSEQHMAVAIDTNITSPGMIVFTKGTKILAVAVLLIKLDNSTVKYDMKSSAVILCSGKFIFAAA